MQARSAAVFVLCCLSTATCVGAAAESAGSRATRAVAGARGGGAQPIAGVGAAVRAGESRAVAALDACLPRLDAELDVGLARIEARCPGLAASLEASGVAARLPADWRRPGGDLSVGGLRALRRLLVAPAPVTTTRPVPDLATLSALVAASRGATADAGPWERLMRWLRARIEGAAPDADVRPAWSRWLEGRSPSARAWTMLGYLSLAALAGFLAWVVRGELRASGASFARRRAGGAAAGAGAAEAGEGLEPASVVERPAWLLSRLARRLQSLGRLPAAGALTAREVVRIAQLDDEADRESLRGIAYAAERVRFGAVAPRPGELDGAIGAAQALLARLEAAAAASRGAS